MSGARGTIPANPLEDSRMNLRLTVLSAAALCGMVLPTHAGRTVDADPVPAALEKTDPITAKNAPRVDLLRTYEGPTDWARCVAFQPGGNLLAAGSKDGNLRLWDLASQAPPAVLKCAPC